MKGVPYVSNMRTTTWELVKVGQVEPRDLGGQSGGRG